MLLMRRKNFVIGFGFDLAVDCSRCCCCCAAAAAAAEADVLAPAKRGWPVFRWYVADGWYGLNGDCRWSGTSRAVLLGGGLMYERVSSV